VVKTADDPGLKVVRWEAKDPQPQGAKATAPLKALHVTADAGFRKRVFTAVLDHGGRYSELAITGDGFELPPEAASKTAQEFFSAYNFYDYGRGWYGENYGDEEAMLRMLRGLHPVFISRMNGESAYFHKYLKSNARPADQARLFLYAEAPPEFRMQNDRFQAGAAFVLYVVDIFKP
jgi:hypothetical protein